MSEPELHWLLRPRPGADTPARVVLVLHGGRERSTMAVGPINLSYLRMADFARATRSAARGTGIGVVQLKYAVRGWNDPADPAPVRDARWALAQIRAAYPQVRVALLGHSMGGRTGARIAGDGDVVGVCGLAPWFPPGEPVEQFAGRTLVVAHGTADTWTSPTASYEFCRAVRRVDGRSARAELPGGKHFLLMHLGDWRRFAARVSLGLLGQPMPPLVADALGSADQRSLRLALAEAAEF